MRCTRAFLLAVLSTLLWASSVEAGWGRKGPSQAFLLFSNTSAFDGLDQPNWRQRLERDVLPVLRRSYNLDAPLPGVPELEPVESGNLSAAFAWTRRELKCHLKFYALVCGALVRAQADLVQPRGPSWWPAPPRSPKWAPAWASLRELGAEIENNLALTVHLLHHNQTVAALALSQHMSLALGWEWSQGGAAHLTTAGGGFAPCWDEIAVMATLLDPEAPNQETTFAYQLSLGGLHTAWQAQLEQFFEGSIQHAMPWRTQGNMLLLPAEASGLSTAVEWVLPAGIFQERTTIPTQQDAEGFEGPPFASGGYGWSPLILVDSLADVTVGLKLWGPHMPPLEPPSGFFVELTAVHPGGEDWRTDFLCTWPQGFASCTFGGFCVQRDVLPLWPMLSGKAFGFVPHGELLLRIRVTPVPIKPASGAADGTCLPPAVGPLGAQPRLLFGPVMRWGHEAAHASLWGTHGFDSRRLLATSGEAADELLGQLRAERFAAAPFVEDVLDRMREQFGEAAVAAWMQPDELPAAARALQETAFITAGGLLTLACIIVPLAPAVQRAYTQRRTRQRQLQRMRQLAQQGQEAGGQGASEPQQAPSPQQPSPPSPQADKGRRGGSKQAVQQEVRRQQQQQQQRQQPAPTLAPQAPEQHGAGIGRLLAWLRSGRRPQQPMASTTGGTSAAQPAPAPKTPPQKKQLRRRPDSQPGGVLQRQLAVMPAPAGATQASPRRVLTPPPPPAAARRGAPPSSPQPAQQPDLLERLPLPRVPAKELPPFATPSPAPPSPASSPAGSEASSAAPSRAGSRAGSRSSIAATQPPSQALADLSSPAALTAAPREGVLAAAGPTEAAVPAARHSEDMAELMPALAHAFAASEAAEAAAAAVAVAPAAVQAQGAAHEAAAGVPGATLEAAAGPAAAVRPTGAAVAAADPLLIVQAMLPPEQPATSHHGGGGVARQPSQPQAGGSPAALASAAEQEPPDSELCIVCWERRRSCVLIPCGHLCLCRRCAEAQMAGAVPLCPVCRKPLAQAMDVFMP